MRIYAKRTRTGLTWQLAKLAAPIVLSNLSQTLLGVVDTIFMGRVGTGFPGGRRFFGLLRLAGAPRHG